MALRTVFTLTLVACSGQPAPVPLPPAPAPLREVYITPDAGVPIVVGAACDARTPCGPGLTCEGWPGGYCASPCSPAGATCGDGRCVEQLDRAVCLASCVTDADCRANEGYACDPIWHACALPNTTAIVPATCVSPIGFGRDPAFAPPVALGDGREPAAVLADDGTLVVAHEARGDTAIARIDAAARVTTTSLRGGSPRLARDGARLFAITVRDNRIELATSVDRGASWSAAWVVDDECATTRCVRPVVAAGADPAKPGSSIVYVGYIAGDGFRLRASRDGGTTFTPARTALPGIRGALAIDAKGVVYALALRGNPRVAFGSADSRIDLAISYDSARSFARPQTISRFAEKLPFSGASPQIVVDSNRKILYVAYARGGRDAKWDIVLAAYKQTAFKPAWTYARIGDDPQCAIHVAPALAVDPVNGALHVTWYDSRGMRAAHAACTENLGLCRQLGRINDTPLAGLSLARHSPLAVGDTQALVVDWTRRALHAVWTQGTPDGPRIFSAKAKLPLR